MSHHLLNGDCLELLRALDDESVDLVLTDPPYFIGYDGGDGWDSAWNSEEEYLEWCRAWTVECCRVLKRDRMLVVFGTLRNDTFLRYKLNVINTIPGMRSQNEIVWSYNWGGRSSTNFARKHQIAWCYSKGNKHLFNADAIRVERKQKTNIRTGKDHIMGTIPTCVWEKNNHTMSKEYVGWHPTQKPIELMTRFIKAYTSEGDMVLDPFSGSGSTMIAAVNSGRDFIGSELSALYHEKSLERLDELRVARLPTTDL